MELLPKSLQNLINEFRKLPGVGEKSAIRMAYYYLKVDKSELKNLSNVFLDVANNVHQCTICCNYSNEEICVVCDDSRRNSNVILVVEEPIDAVVFEGMNIYDGVYHVLDGVISPVNGIGPSDIFIDQLFSRLVKKKNELEDGQELELILAITSNLEGEATATYIKNKIDELNLDYVKITSLAQGLPTGADIDYADKQTLQKAYKGRVNY